MYCTLLWRGDSRNPMHTQYYIIFSHNRHNPEQIAATNCWLCKVFVVFEVLAFLFGDRKKRERHTYIHDTCIHSYDDLIVLRKELFSNERYAGELHGCVLEQMRMEKPASQWMGQYFALTRETAAKNRSRRHVADIINPIFLSVFYLEYFVALLFMRTWATKRATTKWIIFI